ncbi:hypothetical protein BD310DRAFT_977227 [Dichomitus squalens]|uniref:Uncharacterized protein n=1 Tax=Dichomitus squalens TaxID=114155 RepID=A0A4Q9PVN2_9APHY|nr:hypothetical protein BD310DRAFT_977227 [Dichomitus squalens]
MRIVGSEVQHVPMTTQAYVLRGNDPQYLSNDIGGFHHSRPDGLVVHYYATSKGEDDKPYRDPERLHADDVELVDAVGRWNTKLKEQSLETHPQRRTTRDQATCGMISREVLFMP